ncbi:MAG: rhomboid family intramembrane serine protease [Candidatus Hadarchaeales archaeon]
MRGRSKKAGDSHFRRMCRASRSYLPLILLVICFSAVAIPVYAAVSAERSLAGWLWLSSERPWGVVTSVVLHVDAPHLINNMTGLLMVTVIFGGVIQIYPSPVRRRWCVAFAILATAAAFIINAVEYLVILSGYGLRTWGASGMVYGATGVLLAAALKSMPAQVTRMVRKWRSGGGKRVLTADIAERMLSGISVVLVFIFLFSIFFDPDGFFGAGPGVNLFAHEMGFLTGFLSATLLGFLRGH